MSPQEMTHLIASYAALVATGSLGWQIYAWTQTRKPRVVVKILWGVPQTQGGQHGWLMIKTVPENLARHEGFVILKVVNRGDHAVNVTGVGFDLQDRSKRKVLLTGPGTLPGIVAAHNEEFAYILESSPECRLLDLHRPVVGWANLATGESINSKATTLRRL